MFDTHALLVNLMLYGILPLWGIAGFVDWCCHRATRIESTSGLKESLIHSLMGVQLGIPILLCLLFEINVLVLLICFAAWLAHEFIAHWDVHYSSPVRHISIWEVHAHNYLATIPFYLLILVVVLSWETFLRLISFEWGGQLSLRLATTPTGGTRYVTTYLVFMGLVCVVPYIEENIRCLRVALNKRRANA